ncbi:MAG: MpaA3 family daptide-type RiPP [Microbacterium sp.]
MQKDMTLHFEELDELDAPLEWWEHASYIITIAIGFAAIAT